MSFFMGDLCEEKYLCVMCVGSFVNRVKNGRFCTNEIRVRGSGGLWCAREVRAPSPSQPLGGRLLAPVAKTPPHIRLWACVTCIHQL